MVAALLFAGATTRSAYASDLYGSRGSMEKQHSVAVDLDYQFALTASQVEKAVESGQLEKVLPNADFQMSGVSFPYAQSAVRMFIERLAAEYHFATGTPLIVTSLTRPESEQPSNASPLSVHPAGMAVDFRLPAQRAARVWLSHRLLALEAEGLLDVTQERRPPHLHVAVFPAAFTAYAARVDSLAAERVTQPAPPIMVIEIPAPAPEVSHASAHWLFASLAGGMLVSLLVAYRRRTSPRLAQLRIKRRHQVSRAPLLERSGTSSS
jgi:hypothetical protein